MRAKGVCHRREHEVRVADGRQPDPEHAVQGLADQPRRRLDGKPRLPGSPRAGQRDEPRRAEQRLHFPDLALTPDERARGPGQIRVRDRLERWKGAAAELEERHRTLHVLQPMLAEVTQRRAVHGGGGGRGDQHLAAVPRAHHPRREMHVSADVALFRERRLAGVEAHAHLYRPCLERPLPCVGGGQGVGGARKGVEERVALRIHLDAAAAAELLPQGAPVLRQHGCVLVAELVQQPRRALDVGEQEGHRAGGQLATHS